MAHPANGVQLYLMDNKPVLKNISRWTWALGFFFLVSPKWFYGPSWSYFHKYIPANGYGMGVCLMILSSWQLIALRRNVSAKTLSVLFFFGGFVFWTAGIILLMEGLRGHQGLQEAPLMLSIGGFKYAYSSSLWVHARQSRIREEELLGE